MLDIAFCKETTTWMDEGRVVDVVHLGFSTASDTVSHNSLNRLERWAEKSHPKLNKDISTRKGISSRLRGVIPSLHSALWATPGVLCLVESNRNDTKEQKHLLHEERLRELDLLSLEKRWLRGDLNKYKVYKYLKRGDVRDISLFIHTHFVGVTKSPDNLIKCSHINNCFGKQCGRWYLSAWWTCLVCA